VAQTRVEHFFDATELGAPQIAHVIEAAVDRVEPGIDMPRSETNQGGVKQYRDADRKIER
jgi:hypothetical protein